MQEGREGMGWESRAVAAAAASRQEMSGETPRGMGTDGRLWTGRLASR